MLLLGMMLLAACTTGAGPATSTATVVLLPYADANEFLETADYRVRFKNWNFSLVLPTADWSLERFTGKNFSEEMTTGIFVRNPLPGRKTSPALTITFNRIPRGLDVEHYSISVMQAKKAYFANTLETFASGDERIHLQNAVGYITKYSRGDQELLGYFVYATHDRTGVQAILVGDTESMSDIQKEVEAILASFQFEE